MRMSIRNSFSELFASDQFPHSISIFLQTISNVNPENSNVECNQFDWMMWKSFPSFEMWNWWESVPYENVQFGVKFAMTVEHRQSAQYLYPDGWIWDTECIPFFIFSEIQNAEKFPEWLIDHKHSRIEI